MDVIGAREMLLGMVVSLAIVTANRLRQESFRRPIQRFRPERSNDLSASITWLAVMIAAAAAALILLLDS